MPDMTIHFPSMPHVNDFREPSGRVDAQLYQQALAAWEQVCLQIANRIGEPTRSEEPPRGR